MKKSFCEMFSSFVCGILDVPEKENKLAGCLLDDPIFNNIISVYINERFGNIRARDGTS